MKVAYPVEAWACAVLLVLSSFGCNVRKNVAVEFNRLAQVALQGTNSVVTFERVTRFEWDRIFIFGPYTPVARIKQQLGYDWSAAKDTGIDMSDSFNLIVFVERGEVVKHLKFNRALGDFHDLKAGNMFQRGADRFQVQKALPGTRATRFNYHPIRDQNSSAQAVVRADLFVANLNASHGLLDSADLSIPDVIRQLEQWATRVGLETERHLYRFRSNPAEYENSEGFYRMLMMTVVLAEDFGVRYNPAKMGVPSEALSNDGFFSDPSDVFIHGLLGPRRMGTCASMPVLYVALGRRLGYPLKLVTTKGHLFVRWEGKRVEPSPQRSGTRHLTPALSPTEAEREEIGECERFNIEVTSRGVNRYDDEHYRHWPFELTDEEFAENGYLKSLTPDEEHAVFLTIRAECLKEAKRFEEAVTAYKEAVRLAPHVRAYRLLLADTERIASESRPRSAENDSALATVEAASKPAPRSKELNR